MTMKAAAHFRLLAFKPGPARLVYLFGLPPNLSTNGGTS
jgi:hypothetical protein